MTRQIFFSFLKPLGIVAYAHCNDVPETSAVHERAEELSKKEKVEAFNSPVCEVPWGDHPNLKVQKKEYQKISAERGRGLHLIKVED